MAEPDAHHAPRTLFACGTDNDGYPTCEGDGSACGPYGTCDHLNVTDDYKGTES